MTTWRAYFKTKAKIEDAFVGDVLVITFPADAQPDADALVTAEVKIRDACRMGAQARDRYDIDDAIRRQNAARIDADAAAELLRAKLGLPRPSF